jgi:dolichol-phosphate mannosyltransferase
VALYIATDQLKIYYLFSAAITTIISTLWNFGLTESMGYGSKIQAKGRVKRLGLFFGMNLLAFLLCSPIIYLLTDVLGIYYVISNLVSLAMLTVLYLTLAERMIWEQISSTSLTI